MVYEIKAPRGPAPATEPPDDKKMPVPMVLRRPGDPFAFNQQPFPDRSPREQGRMGVNTRDFKIPGKEEYKAPKQFREEIIEALKRGAPSQFRGQIEQYFKNLTE